MLAEQPRTKAQLGENVVEPFLRWAGGKRWLTHALAPVLKRRLTGRYFEPFLGAGAMFFAVAPDRAVLSDLNADLMETFRMVAERPTELLEAVRALTVDESTYYRTREDEPEEPFLRAVRFVYLNRTCYGGIYRENKRGKFNTPYGGGSRTPAPLWESSLIERAERMLAKKDVVMEVCDFERMLDTAGSGDVIYCDPAYRAATRAQFDRYGAVVFGWDDQERLATAAKRAAGRGALVVISNTRCSEVKGLYEDATRLLLSKSKAIGKSSKDPDRRKEYLIVLDPEDDAIRWSSIGRVEE